MASDPISEALKKIADLQEKLEATPEPHYSRLAHSRILASTSLSRRLDERKEWDEANLWVAQAIESERKLDLSNLLQLNGIITASSGHFRDRAVYAAGEEYLSLDCFPEALVILEDFLSEENPVARASLVYIFVINVHPFLNGNGRTARLAADWILMDNGYPPLCFVTAAQGHVAQDQAGRIRTLSECVYKCLAGVINGYDILLANTQY